MKKIICLVIVFCICINITTINISANEINASTDVVEEVYIDGVKYEIFVDDNYNIIVEGVTDASEAIMILDSDLEGEIEISNNESKENYDVEIESLEAENINSLMKNEEIEYDNIEVIVTDEENDEEVLFCDDIIEDKYEGQIALSVSFGVITVSGMIAALIKAAIVVTVSGVICYALDKIITQVKKKCKQYYYKAYRCANTVVINPKPISKNSAISRIKCGADVYTYKKAMAKSIMQCTYLGYYGPENHWKRGKIGFFFNHYHLNLHKKNKNSAHMFYGKPVSG